MSPNLTPPSGERPNHLLLKNIWLNGCLLDELCDPKRIEMNAAVALGRQMMDRYRDFDIRLVAELMALPDVVVGKDRRIELCLEILDAVSSGLRITMPLMPLMNSQNHRVRSKVAKILGRRVDNLNWGRKYRNELDDRTRANIIEGLWGGGSPEIREVLWMAVGDGNCRVRGNAILELYRMGEAGILTEIRALAESQDPRLRATVAWVIRATGDPRFRCVLKTLRQDAEASVRAAALRALVQLNKQEDITAQANRAPQIYFCEDVEGVRRVGFDLPESGAPRDGLLHTDLIVTEDCELVWDYALVERKSHPLLAVFLIFDGPEAKGLPGLKQAFAECLDRKYNGDRWSVVRMAAWPEGDFDEVGSVRPPYRGPKLEQAMARFDELLRVQTRELSRVVRLLKTEDPGRHLVLLLPPSALSDSDLDSLEVAALDWRFSVDVISFGSTENEKLQKLTRQTGGVFGIAPAGAISPDWMVRTYASMAHRYEVSHPRIGSGESAFEITILPPQRHSGSVKGAG
jgi:hypothetical protein